MAINDNQENNSKKPLARGGFRFVVGSEKAPEVGEEFSFFGNGQEHFVAVEMYEGHEVKRNANVNKNDFHPVKAFKEIVEKICNNQMMQNNVKNEMQVSPVKLQPVNGLAK